MSIRPRSTLTKTEWLAAYKVARMCKYGEVKHGPVNMIAKYWALSNIVRSV